MLRRVLGLLLIGCWVPLALTAQTVTVRGQQEGQQRPLPQASVALKALSGPQKGRQVVRVTDSSGQVGVPFSSRTAVRIQKLGYRPLADTLAAGASKTYRLRGAGLKLAPQVITGSYEPQREDEATYNLRVIDAEQIERQAANNLADLLANSLNIRLSQDNVLGTAMSLQGLSGQNVKIMIDNVPVIGRLDGNIDLAQVNLNNVQRIEVIEGPMSVNYGSDALAGVVNIITKKGGQRDGTLSLGGTGYYESVGDYNGDGFLGYHDGDHTLRLSGGRYFFDGWRSPNDRAPYDRWQSWKPREQYFLRGMYRFAPEWGSLRYNGRFFQGTIFNRGRPRVTPYRAYAIDEEYQTRRQSHQIQAQTELGDHHRLNVIAAFNDYWRRKRSYRKNLVALERQPVGDPQAHDTTNFQLYLSRGTIARVKPGSNWQYQLGYEVNHETGSGQRLEGGRQHLGDYALFGSVEYRPVADLTLRPALRAAYNTRYPAPLLPAFNVKYSLGRHLTLRGGYGRGFRAPSLKELYLFFVDVNHNIRGNADLQAETAHHGDLSLNYRRVLDHVGLRAEWMSYYNKVRNKIELAQLDPETNLFTYANIGEVQTMGSRAEVSLVHERFELTAGGGVIGVSPRIDREQFDVPAFTYSPEARLNLHYRVPLVDISLNAFYRYVGRNVNYAVDEQGRAFQTWVEDYHLLDANLSRSFWQDRVRLSLGAKNLMNVRSLAANFSGGAHSGPTSSVPMMTGRTVFARLQLQFDQPLKPGGGNE
jgi:outer membrane receptor for ferrienterochelin and colicins